MVPYHCETVRCYSYRTKCRVGDRFYSYFPIIPRRLCLCTISTIEISDSDITYFYCSEAADDSNITNPLIQSVTDKTFDDMLFKTEEEALEALKEYLLARKGDKIKFEVDNKTGRWTQIWKH